MHDNFLYGGIALIVLTVIIRLFEHKSRILHLIRRDQYPLLLAWGFVALGIGILNGTDFTVTENQTAMTIVGFLLMLVTPATRRDDA